MIIRQFKNSKLESNILYSLDGYRYTISKKEGHYVENSILFEIELKKKIREFIENREYKNHIFYESNISIKDVFPDYLLDYISKKEYIIECLSHCFPWQYLFMYENDEDFKKQLVNKFTQHYYMFMDKEYYEYIGVYKKDIKNIFIDFIDIKWFKKFLISTELSYKKFNKEKQDIFICKIKDNYKNNFIESINDTFAKEESIINIESKTSNKAILPQSSYVLKENNKKISYYFEEKHDSQIKNSTWTLDETIFQQEFNNFKENLIAKEYEIKTIKSFNTNINSKFKKHICFCFKHYISNYISLDIIKNDKNLIKKQLIDNFYQNIDNCFIEELNKTIYESDLINDCSKDNVQQLLVDNLDDMLINTLSKGFSDIDSILLKDFEANIKKEIINDLFVCLNNNIHERNHIIIKTNDQNINLNNNDLYIYNKYIKDFNNKKIVNLSSLNDNLNIIDLLEEFKENFDFEQEFEIQLQPDSRFSFEYDVDKKYLIDFLLEHTCLVRSFKQKNNGGSDYIKENLKSYNNTLTFEGYNKEKVLEFLLEHGLIETLENNDFCLETYYKNSIKDNSLDIKLDDNKYLYHELAFNQTPKDSDLDIANEKLVSKFSSILDNKGLLSLKLRILSGNNKTTSFSEDTYDGIDEGIGLRYGDISEIKNHKSNIIFVMKRNIINRKEILCLKYNNFKGSRRENEADYYSYEQQCYNKYNDDNLNLLSEEILDDNKNNKFVWRSRSIQYFLNKEACSSSEILVKDLILLDEISKIIILGDLKLYKKICEDQGIQNILKEFNICIEFKNTK